MHPMFLPALCALVPLMLAACENPESAGAPGVEVARDAPRHCGHCGWIESKRELRPADAAVVYEYTVRMADGSSGVFRDTQPSTLREGERLIYLKSAAAAD